MIITKSQNMTKTLSFIFFLIIGNSVYSQLNYGLGISLQYLSIGMYSIEREPKFRDKSMPSTKLLFYIEPTFKRSQNRFRFGLEATYYTNGYRNEYYYHYYTGKGSPSNHYYYHEKAQFHDFRLGISSSYLYSFDKEKSTTYELGVDLNISQSIKQKFTSQWRSLTTITKGNYYSYPSPPEPYEIYEDEDLADTIKKPDFNSLFMSVMLTTGIRFGKNQNSAIHFSFGVNFSPRIDKYQVVNTFDYSVYEQKRFTLSTILTGQLQYTYTIGSFRKKKQAKD